MIKTILVKLFSENLLSIIAVDLEYEVMLFHAFVALKHKMFYRV